MRFIGERNGELVDIRFAVANRLDEQGKLAEGWYLPDDQKAFDRIFGP